MKLPHRGAPQTVAVIVDGALRSQEDARLGCRTIAEAVCYDVCERDYLSQALAIGNYVEQRVTYFRDPRTVELVKAPEVVAAEVLSGGKPMVDCDDEAAFVAGLGLAAGFSVRITCYAFQHMFYRGERQFSHTSAQLLEPRTGVWIVVDPVAGPNTANMLTRVVAVRHWMVA